MSEGLYSMEAKDYDKTLDLTKIKPYGDTMNDGKTQLSFTLPVPYGDEATEAAKQLLKKMGFENPLVVYSKELTKERLEVFDKAVEKEDGVHYTPIAYLASQVVAGTNHSFLCKATDVTEDAEESYMIVNIYEDLEGNAEILDVENADPDKYSDLINQAK